MQSLRISSAVLRVGVGDYMPSVRNRQSSNKVASCAVAFIPRTICDGVLHGREWSHLFCWGCTIRALVIVPGVNHYADHHIEEKKRKKGFELRSIPR